MGKIEVFPTANAVSCWRRQHSLTPFFGQDQGGLSLLQAEVLRRAIKDFAIVCAGNALCLIKTGQRGLRAGMRRYGFLNVDCLNMSLVGKVRWITQAGFKGLEYLGRALLRMIW